MSVVADNLELFGNPGCEMTADAKISIKLPATMKQVIDIPLTLGVCEPTGTPCLYFDLTPVRAAIADDDVRGRRKHMHLMR